MSITKKKSTQLYPLEWGKNPNIVLYLGFLQTTANKFGVEITLTGKNNFSKSFTVDYKQRSFSFYNINHVVIPDSALPVTLTANITCSTDFKIDAAFQAGLGKKDIKGSQVPVCYQSTIFCNDNVNDKNPDQDYNDFVIIAQLYNSSTDG